MKKNVMMRIAAVLLVAVLFTSSTISGTFAKYTTGANASDTARVAKWGVTAAVTGDAFAEQYTADSNSTTGLSLGVKTVAADDDANTDNVIAPGTTGTFTGVALTGTPEVAVTITKTATVTFTGWMIDDDGDNTTPNKFYCPMIININGENINGLNFASGDAFAAAIKTAIEAANGNYEPLTNLASIANMNGNYTWTWQIDSLTGTEIDQSDKYDTMLAKLEDAGTSNKITLGVDVTVTQAD